MDISKTSNEANCTGRRDFLKSLFGVKVTEKPPAGSAPAGDFYWADLKTGQVGFPTGTKIIPGLPGSIMKLVATAAIKEEKLLSENVQLECDGSINVGGANYVCQIPHGRLSLVEALAKSCNVFFAQAANSISPQVILHWAGVLGFNHPAAGFSAGQFPLHPSAHSQNYVLVLADDLQVNAMQILQLSGLIATRGNLPVLHSADKPPAAGQSLSVHLSERTWTVLQQGMHLACREGTAKHLDVEDRLHVAAKTGTTPHGKTFQSWVTGYFPYNSPRYAFCVRARSGTSQEQAIPIARTHLFATVWP